MKKLIGVIGVVVAVLVIVFVAMGSSDTETASTDEFTDQSSQSDAAANTGTDTPEQSADTIEIRDFKYAPEKMTVKKGTTVTWKNFDNTKHNVVFDDESAGEVEGGKLIGNGEEVSFTFNEVGDFSYFCEPHPYMKASVTVTE